MVKMERYACDSCDENFSIPEGSKPYRLTLTDSGANPKVVLGLDLCARCKDRFDDWFENVKERDAAADKLAGEER